MANAPDEFQGGPAPPSSTLPRGKACLRCRKRKMRCDGGPGPCAQCARSKKGVKCEYDDGKGKTRTQLLRDNIHRLEQRIKELEDPEYTSPSVVLHNPHGQRTSMSFTESPVSTSISAAASPFSSGSPSSSRDSWSGVPAFSSPSPAPFGGDVYKHEPLPPFEISQLMLNIFEPHRHQCGLEIQIDSLRASLSLPTSQQRHPALMNAVFLWACYVSRPDPISQQEGLYLDRALSALKDAIKSTDKVIDAIQATCLLSTYFLSNGRLVEGGYHCSAAAALATQCGLHQPIAADLSSWTASVSGAQLILKPAVDAIEQRERNLTFWQAYNLDRCWSVVLKKPVVIPDGRQGWNSINVPWPQSVSEFEMTQGHTNDSAGFQTMRSFLEGAVNGGYSTLAQRVKASGLYQLADNLSACWDPRTSLSANFHEDARALESIIDRFLSTLVPLFQIEGAPTEDKYTLITSHVLVQAALIQLYRRFARDDPVCYEKCIGAARGIVSILKHVSDTDYPFLDPIVGPCCCSAAEMLVRELDSIEVSWPLLSSSDVRNEIGVLMYALTNFSGQSGWAASSLANIQKRLTEV